MVSSCGMSIEAPAEDLGGVDADGWPERLALVGMHLAVAAVLVPVFALTIRPSQRPVEDAPGNSDAGRRPSAPAEARR